MDLISVVVPVYNIEKYIRECVDSIRSQTYSELEILLVDDGSSDKSGEICDEYSELDVRIKAVHKSNGGLSDARNCGIRNATGEWIAFIDGDDWIHPQMIEVLHSIVIESEADIACCKYRKVFDDSSVDFRPISIDGRYRCFDKNLAITMIPEIGQEAWNKLYRKSIFDSITFPVGRFHEDEFTIHRIIWNSNRIACVDNELYYYRHRHGSIMNTPSMKAQLDAFDAYNDRIEFIEEMRWDAALQKTVNDYLAYLVNRYFFYINGKDNASKKMCRLAIKKSKSLIGKYGKETDHLYKLFSCNRCLFLAVLKLQAIWMLLSKRIISR